MKNCKTVAVVGGGIFGCTSAWMLAKEGFDVALFEKESDIFKGTSSINQFRLHKGYHYPRSIETALSSKNSEYEFLEVYGDAVVESDTKNYYCISKNKSKVTKNAYLRFLSQTGLPYSNNSPPFIFNENIDLCILCDEKLYNPLILKDICKKYLEIQKVKINLNTEVSKEDLLGFDYIVNATYSNLNSILNKKEWQRYQFELCEKPILKLPEQYKNQSVVIMDGPFTCIDPLKGTPYHVIGNVKHAIHKTNTGFFPEADEKFKDLLNKGVVSNPSITNIDKFYETATLFFKDVSKFQYIGSMYTYRAVLPGRDSDDARPTLINKVNDRMFTIFSGKVGTCVSATKELIKHLNELR